MYLTALASLTTAAAAYGADAPRIARWYQNYDGAVSLRFDDSLESHVRTAIPLLNDYGFRATFMVNPGLQRYRDHRDFWERQVPAMGHRLGNHTMHHRGARTVEEAEYEIGEVSRMIWRAYPGESKLLEFASGGGGLTWGGKAWSDADPSYRQLMEKYHLVDLYDGNHPYIGVRADSRTEDLCSRLDRTADEQGHQAFVFHNIGRPSIMDRIKALYRGYDLTTNSEVFSGFLRCLDERRRRLWVAPLIDILKYGEEARNASLQVLTTAENRSTLTLAVRTDAVLYDHKLTVVLPVSQGATVKTVRQDDDVLRTYQRSPGEYLVDLKPVNSTITVYYSAMRAGYQRKKQEAPADALTAGDARTGSHEYTGNH